MASSNVMRSSWVEEDPSDEGPRGSSMDDRENENEETRIFEIMSMDSSGEEEEVEVTEVEEEEEEEEFEDVFNVNTNDNDDDDEDRSDNKQGNNNDRHNVLGEDEEEEYEASSPRAGLGNLPPPMSPLQESDEDNNNNDDEYETIEEGNRQQSSSSPEQQQQQEEHEGTEHQVGNEDEEDEDDDEEDYNRATYGQSEQDDDEQRYYSDNSPNAGDDRRYVGAAGAADMSAAVAYLDPFGQKDNDSEDNPRGGADAAGPYNVGLLPNHCNIDNYNNNDNDDASPPSQPPPPPSPPPSPQQVVADTAGMATAVAEERQEQAITDNKKKNSSSSSSSGGDRRRLLSSSSSSWWCMCCIILILLAALGTVLGIFLTRDNKSNNNSDDNNNDSKDAPTTEKTNATVVYNLVAVQGFSGPTGTGFGSSVALIDKFIVLGSPTIGDLTGTNTTTNATTTTTTPTTTGIVSTFLQDNNNNDNGDDASDATAVDVANANSGGGGGGGGGGSDGLVVVDFGDAWKFLEEIAGQEEEGQFGFTVDLVSAGGGGGGAQGDNTGEKTSSALSAMMLIGAPHVPASGTAIPAGAAYFFQFNPSTNKWDQQGSAMQGGAELFNANEEFGAALAASSTATTYNVRLVIGAPGNNEAGKGAGRIYIYQRQNPASDWEEMSTVPLLGEAEGARLGSAVDISVRTGNVIVAGAPDGNSISIYEYNGQEWIRTFLHTATDVGGLFGSSVVLLSDNIVAVGSPSEGSNSGAIHLFQKVDGVWKSGGPTITGESGDALGSPRTIDGTVGPLGPELTVGTSSGIVKRFDLIAGSWVQRFAVSTGTTVSTLSISSDNDSDLLLVGNKDENKVTLYRENIQQSQQTAPEPSPNDGPVVPPSNESPVADNGPVVPPSNEPPVADPNDSPTTTPPPPYTEESTSAPTSATELTWQSVFTFDGLPNSAVSLGESIFAVGVPSFSSGVVQTFQRKENEWESLRAIYEADSVDFGESVSMAEGTTGTYLAVGAPGTLYNSGAVFFYLLDGEALTQLGSTIRPPVSSSGSSGKFGASVVAATQMLHVAIGEPESIAAATGARTGRVHIMEFDVDEWTQMATIEGSTTGGLYGSAIDMTKDGKRLLVGAPGSTNGEVYYYEWDGLEWKKIFAVPGSESGEALGTAVAILSDDGNLIAMGAPKFGSNKEGVVRVYERKDDGFFSKIGSDIVGSPNEAIGSTLSGSSGRLVVGSASGNFHAFSYDLNAGEWVQVGTTPTITSGITAIATRGDATDVVVGFKSEQVIVYNLS